MICAHVEVEKSIKTVVVRINNNSNIDWHCRGVSLSYNIKIFQRLSTQWVDNFEYYSHGRITEHYDEDIAKYSVLKGNEQLFASKYKLYLPTEEELRAEIENQKTIFELQQQNKQDLDNN